MPLSLSYPRHLDMVRPKTLEVLPCAMIMAPPDNRLAAARKHSKAIPTRVKPDLPTKTREQTPVRVKQRAKTPPGSLEKLNDEAPTLKILLMTLFARRSLLVCLRTKRGAPFVATRTCRLALIEMPPLYDVRTT